MTLSNYQYSWNGFTFGAGTPYIVEEVDGLVTTAPLRVQDDNRGYIDGTLSGRDFYDARTITFKLLIIGDSSHNAQYYFYQLKQNIVPQTLGYPSSLGLLQFALPGWTGNLQILGRIRNVESVIDPEWAIGYIPVTVEIYCPDPRYYDDTAVVGTASTVGVANNGWATTCPTIYIASPSSSFILTAIAAGTTIATMNFQNVTTSSDVTIDLLNRTITQGGVAARNIMQYSTGWLYAPAGLTTNFTINTGTMQVTYRSAYI